jgi:hypothetical protein
MPADHRQMDCGGSHQGGGAVASGDYQGAFDLPAVHAAVEHGAACSANARAEVFTVNIKNYTSSTAASTTISFIEAYLAECGVTGISKQYKDGIPVALFFHIDLPPSRYTVRLPAKIDECQEYLWRQYCTATRRPRKTKEEFREQASRTAWKIQQDWVQVQMSLIKLKQVDFLQVFMGFLWDGQQSYYDTLTANKFKALPQSS